MYILRVFLASCILLSNCAASQYPENELDREIREMGSITKNKAVFTKEAFTSGPPKENRKLQQSTNGYLFQAALHILKFAPLISADSMAGVVITDWYSLPENDNLQYKIMVYVKGGDISEKSLEVVSFERRKTEEGWDSGNKSCAVSSVLEKKILQKAKELHLKNSK